MIAFAHLVSGEWEGMPRTSKLVLLMFLVGSLRREQLTGEIMDPMAEAKYLADEGEEIYNHERPHRSLDGMAPSRYWQHWAAENQLGIA